MLEYTGKKINTAESVYKERESKGGREAAAKEKVIVGELIFSFSIFNFIWSLVNMLAMQFTPKVVPFECQTVNFRGDSSVLLNARLENVTLSLSREKCQF